MCVPPIHLATSASRTLSSWLPAARPGYRLRTSVRTTATLAQAKAAPESAEFLDSLTPQDYIKHKEHIQHRQPCARPVPRLGIPQKDPRALKRPTNAFVLFSADVRADPTKFPDFPGFSDTSAKGATYQAKVLAAYWKEMKEDIKQKYLLQAESEREVYKEQATKLLATALGAERNVHGVVKRLQTPKRLWSIWQLVVQDVVRGLKTDGRKMSQALARESFRLASIKNQSLSDEERKSYQARLDRHREVWEAEMSKFLDSLSPKDYFEYNEHIQHRRTCARPVPRSGIPKKDPRALKRPSGAFILFSADVRANPAKFPNFPGLSDISAKGGTYQSKVLAAYWREMKADIKQGYLDEAERNMKSFKQETEKYEIQLGLKK